ncbi:MAG TPA: hypothetical protein VMU22_04835 [Rhizomicrobium sp.]|nr:hypothetical protein [Rhizomicrobium sp.]
MPILSAVTHIFADLLIFVGAMAVLFVLLVIAAFRMPAGSSLRRVATALCLRVAASLGAGIIAIPIEPVPGVDIAYDVAAAIALAIYWLSFFVTAARILLENRPRPA